MKRLVFLLVAVLFAVLPAVASPTKDELSFSASLFNANEGSTVWSANGEYLIGLGASFLAGPSVGIFDLGDTDGGRFGVAGKLRVGKDGGFFVGGALHKLTGDAADSASLTAEARAGVDFGGQNAFAEFMALQRWSRSVGGAVTDPDGTAVTAGLVLRFGK